jgi:hypothetical protein
LFWETGALKFNNPDVFDYAVCQRESDQAYYLLRDRDWSKELCGPYFESEILRAFRLADDAQDLSYIYLTEWIEYWFDKQKPALVSNELLNQDYRRIDISYLPISITRYAWTGDQRVKRVSRLACLESKAPAIGFPPDPTVDTRHLKGDVDPQLSGYLMHEWNAHPVGSLLLTATNIEDDLVLILDFPIASGPILTLG